MKRRIIEYKPSPGKQNLTRRLYLCALTLWRSLWLPTCLVGGLAVGARLLGELIGVCTADTDATRVPKGIQAAGAEGGQGRFVGLVGKSTAHNHYLRVIRMNIRYGKSPLP